MGPTIGEVNNKLRNSSIPVEQMRASALQTHASKNEMAGGQINKRKGDMDITRRDTVPVKPSSKHLTMENERPLTNAFEVVEAGQEKQ